MQSILLQDSSCSGYGNQKPRFASQFAAGFLNETRVSAEEECNI